VEQVELDVALEELESRLERLRGLYEQYFLGLEKIEPAVARKDVDRRIYVLRREKIRNTAKRFKLQTIIQRYNTFQQYWQRICREIENGTYKRHLLRAQKGNGNLLTIAARKRLGRGARTSQPPETAPTSQPPSAPPSAPPVPAPEPIAAPAAARVAAPQPAAISAMAPVAPVATPPAAAAPAKPPPKMPPAKPAPQKFESLDLDMDFMGDWDPGARRPGAPSKPVAVAKPAPAPTPAASRPASIPPQPVAVPPRPASSRPPRPPAHPIVASPRIPAAPRVSPAVPPKPAVVPAKPAAAVPPAKPAPAPAPAAAAPKPAAAAPSGFDDARMRDLHTKLQQAKQQTKEANVSFEGLAKSIRATEAKLREQHKNRKIEFDVIIKDGKAVVKPIVK
jgi:hypothetical protein